MNLDTSIVENKGLSQNNCMAKCVDPDNFEPSYLDLHCLQRYLHWSAGKKGLRARFYSP